MLNIFGKQFMNIGVSMMAVRDNKNNRNSPFLLVGAVDNKKEHFKFNIISGCKDL